MDPTLRTLLISRLDGSDLDADARAEVIAATGTEVGEEASGPKSEVYLKSVTVKGFRGIGPAARLELPAQPGLTVVVGRNGSGKSSFAEGLELLLTGTTKRWESRTKNWSASWQSLHADGPTRVAAELVVAGEGAPVALEQEWARGVPYTDATGRDDVSKELTARGWASAFKSFRPFLAYAELASMFDKLTSLYEALSPILGLEDVDAVLARVRDRRLERDNRVKAVKAARVALIASLDDGDPRQEQLGTLLLKPKLDLVRDHLAAHPHGTSATDDTSTALRKIAQQPIPDEEDLRTAFSGLEDAEAELAALSVTDAADALRTAELLSRALEFAGDCPVCGTEDVLDEEWAASAGATVTELRTRARALEAATARLAMVRSAWTGLGSALAQFVGEPAGGERSLDDVLALAADARRISGRARTQLEEQDTVWRSRIEATQEWLATARTVEKEAHGLKAMKAAEAWLKSAADVLRNERFAPIAEQAIANWELLRQESNVELRDITLRTVGRSRQAEFDVRADGAEADAFGVMSQGELLALAVSVFLPRAGLDESPFRFSVIDDPVQSMDPAKVDGLARVLAQAAASRQVVVFTHDDRLPEAVRRLKISATVLQVNRRSKSAVSVSESLTPMRRHLDDARSLAKSDKVPAEVRDRVVPALCREAVEAACAEIVRGRAVAAGEPFAEIDERLRGARSLRSQLALALLDDPSEHLQLNASLSSLGGNELVAALNKGVHGEWSGDQLALHRKTREFIHALMAAA